MTNFVITEEVRNGILQYLIHRPMAEVERAVYELRNLREIQPEIEAPHEIAQVQHPDEGLR